MRKRGSTHETDETPHTSTVSRGFSPSIYRRIDENENAAVEKVIGSNGGDENDDEGIKELV